jgi:hypothetical protein
MWSQFHEPACLIQPQFPQETFQNYSIPGSVVGGPVSISESSSNYGTPSGTENTDSELYTAQETSNTDAEYYSVHQQREKYHCDSYGAMQPQQ